MVGSVLAALSRRLCRELEIVCWGPQLATASDSPAAGCLHCLAAHPDGAASTYPLGLPAPTAMTCFVLPLLLSFTFFPTVFHLHSSTSSST